MDKIPPSTRPHQPVESQPPLSAQGQDQQPPETTTSFDVVPQKNTLIAQNTGQCRYAKLFTIQEGVQKQLPLTVQFKGRTHKLNLTLPKDHERGVGGWFPGGIYETWFLPGGGIHYAIKFDEGQNELVATPTGQVISIKTGVFGFVNEDCKASFQTTFGEEIEDANKYPQGTIRQGKASQDKNRVHVSFRDLNLISLALHDITVNNQYARLDFLATERDAGILRESVRFVCNHISSANQQQALRALSPVFSNPRISKEQQKEIISAMLGTDLSRSFGFGFGPTTLATKQAVYELMESWLGDQYQQDGSLSKETRTRAKLRACEMVPMMIAGKTDVSLESSQICTIVQKLCVLTMDANNDIKLGAFSALMRLSNRLTPWDKKNLLEEYADFLKTNINTTEDKKVALVKINFELGLMDYRDPFFFSGHSLSDNCELEKTAIWESIAAQINKTGLAKENLERGISAVFAIGSSGMVTEHEEIFLRHLLVKLANEHKNDENHEHQLQINVCRINDAEVRKWIEDIITEEIPAFTFCTPVKVSEETKTKPSSETQSGPSPQNKRTTTLSPARSDNKPTGNTYDLSFVEDKIRNRIVPPELKDALQSGEWAEPIRKDVMTTLLNTGTKDWFEAGYRFAQRYHMLDALHKYLRQFFGKGVTAYSLAVFSPDFEGAPDDKETRDIVEEYAKKYFKKNDPEQSQQNFDLLRALALPVFLPPDDFTIETASRLLSIILAPDETAPKKTGASRPTSLDSYPLENRIADLEKLLSLDLVAKDKLKDVEAFVLKAYDQEDVAETFMAETILSVTDKLLQAMQKNEIKPDKKIALKKDDYLTFGHFYKGEIISAEELNRSIERGSSDDAFGALDKATAIFLERDFTKKLLGKEGLKLNDQKKLLKLEQALGLGLFHHSGRVADKAEEVHARYNAWKFLVIPSDEAGETARTVLLVRQPEKQTGGPSNKSSLNVFMVDVSGKISSETADRVIEAFKLPRAHTRKFIAIEGYKRNPQLESHNLKELVVPVNPDKKGHTNHYAMKLFEDVGLDTVIHAIMHPVWDYLTAGGQTQFIELHMRSQDPDDFSEPYGQTDYLEDFATLGEAWARSSASTLESAVSLARTGDADKLNKLLLFLTAYSTGSSDSIPAHQIAFDPQNREELNSFNYQCIKQNGRVIQIKTEFTKYTFRYTGAVVTEVVEEW
ncbi:MAG: hypothetical protein HQM16_09485 [Deltaproteobacteria bacterium]|nr:hypothetical protein [Deltaproteobacteria bacterium]